jgi:hypothetical protein
MVSITILLQNKILYQERENIIESAQKCREPYGDPDHDQRKARRLAPRRPINVTDLGFRLTKEFCYSREHFSLIFPIKIPLYSRLEVKRV